MQTNLLLPLLSVLLLKLIYYENANKTNSYFVLKFSYIFAAYISYKMITVLYFIHITFFFVTGVLCNGCESGWIYHNNRCYAMFEKIRNFNKSRTYCKNEGGAFASIPDDNVQIFLQNKGMFLSNRHLCVLVKMVWYLIIISPMFLIQTLPK